VDYSQKKEFSIWEADRRERKIIYENSKKLYQRLVGRKEQNR